MLKNVDPLLTPQILFALASMGHGDEVAIVDAHYPAATAGRETVTGEALRIDGDTPRVLRAVLSVFPLDEFVEHPAERMLVDNAPEFLPHVQLEAQAELDRANGRPTPFATIPRKTYYERAKLTHTVIITAEMRGWGCFIFRKGLEVTPDLPNTQRHSTTSQWNTPTDS